MPDVTKYDGHGDPVIHLRSYAVVMRTTCFFEEQIASMFPTSLFGNASTWYHTLDKATMEDWGLLTTAFVNQFSYNTEMAITLRDFDQTKQGLMKPSLIL